MIFIWVLKPKIGGFHPKWMVKIMENPMNKWDEFGVSPIFGNIHMYVHVVTYTSFQALKHVVHQLNFKIDDLYINILISVGPTS